MPILVLVFDLDTCQVSRLPMEANQPADQKLGAVFGRLCEGLVQEEGITNRAIEDAIDNVGKSFALFLYQFDCSDRAEIKQDLRRGFGSS